MFLSQVSYAACPLPVKPVSPQASILFVNGIMNDYQGACDSATALMTSLKGNGIDANKFQFRFFFNPTEGGLGDVTELRMQAALSSYARKLATSGDVDEYYDKLGSLYKTISSGSTTCSDFFAYRSDIFPWSTIIYKYNNLNVLERKAEKEACDRIIATTNRLKSVFVKRLLDGPLIVVPHSQGNFYTEAAYGILKYERYADIGKIRVVGVAAIAKFPVGGKYVTIEQDNALYLLQAINTEGIFKSEYSPAPPSNVACVISLGCNGTNTANTDPALIADAANTSGIDIISYLDRFDGMASVWPELRDYLLNRIPSGTSYLLHEFTPIYLNEKLGDWRTGTSIPKLVANLVVSAANELGVSAYSNFNLASDFSATANPNGAWSYGFSPYVSIGSFNAFTGHDIAPYSNDYPGMKFWTANTSYSLYVAKNTSAATINFAGASVPAGSIALAPGRDGQFSIARWTAPQAGTFDIATTFTLAETSGTVDTYVRRNGVNIFTTGLGGSTRTASTTNRVTVAVGDIVDFAVGIGGDNYLADTTLLSVNIALAGSPPGPITNPANGNRYELITCGTWMQCRDAAQLRGGTLTTIRNQAENTWLVANIIPAATGDYGGWIGLNDAASPGVDVWQSGEPVGFTNWTSGNPSRGPEHYVHIYKSGTRQGEWNDLINDTGGVVVQAIVEYRKVEIGNQIHINVADFKSTSLNIAVDNSATCRTGLVYNGPPYTDRPNKGEWDITVPTSGRYAISVEYSAEQSRPVSAAIDGSQFNSSALGGMNGTWCSNPTMTDIIGEVQLEIGSHIFKLERGSVFPHLKNIYLKRVQ